MPTDAERYARLQALFREARRLDGAAREDLLDERCAGDAALRRDVEALLASFEGDGSDALSDDRIEAARGALEGLLPSDDPAAAASGERPGDVIDRYRLVERIGEGGMGTVWRAEQSEPVRREVALKVVKLGMDTREVVRRFEAERQALAMMDHPHVARVLDGGATESGRPYFVMELVAGEPITEYCDRRRLGLRERLALFVDVCRAVQHAHQKGIVHRDLKPSNVLVAEVDGAPVPKVIDFGIAKATGDDLTEATLVTRQAQLLGTPAYMAPEQADLNGADVDTRVDVYALGVLLYELLTGTLPFDVTRALESGFDELLRTIREVDPPRPSTRVSTRDAGTDEAAANRHVDVEGLRRHLRGDLDWIVMKALEKERDRRYASASAFADDVERYLADEPVEAVPPSAAYRWRKLVKRRRKTVVAVAAIVVLFVVGAVGTGVGFWNSVKANRALKVSLKEEERQRHLAQESERRARDAEADAEERADELEQVLTFNGGQLRGLDVEQMGSRLERALSSAAPVKLREALEAAAADLNFTDIARGVLQENIFEPTVEAIRARFEHQPLVRARLLNDVGVTMLELDLDENVMESLETALAIRREELGDEHPKTLGSLQTLGVSLRHAGRWSEAEARLQEALDGQVRVLGEEHRDSILSISSLAALFNEMGSHEDAAVYARRALRLSKRALGEDAVETLARIGDLAAVLATQTRFQEAESLYRELLERQRRLLGDTHADTLITRINLGGVLLRRGLLDEAGALLEEALIDARRVLGDENHWTLNARSRLANVLSKQGKGLAGEAQLREVLDVRRRVLGGRHPVTLSSALDLSVELRRQKRFQEAEDLFRPTLRDLRVVYGDDHQLTLSAHNALAIALEGQGKIDAAERAFRDVLERMRRVQAESPETWFCASLLARLLGRRGSVAEAEELYREALALQRHVLGEAHPDTLFTADFFGRMLYENDRAADAETLYREVVRVTGQQLGDEHPKTLAFKYGLGGVLCLQEKLDEAELVLRSVLDAQERSVGEDHPETLWTLEALALTYRKLARLQDEERCVRTLWTRSRSVYGEEGDEVRAAARSLRDVLMRRVELARAGDDLELAVALAKLGAHLVSGAEYDEAEPALSDALAILDRLPPGVGPDRALVESDLGVAIARRGRFAEAEPLLLSAAERRSTPSSVQRLIDLYDAWHAAEPEAGHDAQAMAWRDRLRELADPPAGS